MAYREPKQTFGNAKPQPKPNFLVPEEAAPGKGMYDRRRSDITKVKKSPDVSGPGFKGSGLSNPKDFGC
jgi:hypothetical protein